MSIVDFNTAIWTDPWFLRLSVPAKFLFIYLWTNNHKNLAALYPIAIETISVETGLLKEEIDNLLVELKPKVKYDREYELVWIVNHVRHQFMRKSDTISPTIQIKLVRDLRAIPDNQSFKIEFLEQYPMLQRQYQDTVSG